MSGEKYPQTPHEAGRHEVEDESEFLYDADRAEAEAIMLEKGMPMESADTEQIDNAAEAAFPEEDIGYDKAEAEAIETNNGEKTDIAAVRFYMIKNLRRQLDVLNRAVQQNSYLSEDFQSEFPNAKFNDFAYGTRNEQAVAWIEAKVEELESALTSLETAIREEGGETTPVNTTPGEPGNVDSPENVPPGPGADPIGPTGAENIKQGANENPEAKEKNSKWQWLKKRLKGIVSFGWTDLHEAENFRSTTKSVWAAVDARSRRLKQTSDLDLTTAQKEANTIRDMVNALGDDKLSVENIELAAAQIEAENTAFNEQLIDNIVTRAETQIKEKLSNYTTDYNQTLLTPEKLAFFRQELEATLKQSTIGLGQRTEGIVKKEINFKKIIRQKLDSKYWKRYLYAGFDAGVMSSLAALSYIYATFDSTGEAARALLPDSVNQLLGADSVTPNIPVAPDSIQAAPKVAAKLAEQISVSNPENLPMKDTIWNTAKDWLVQHGLTNPTDTQVLEISKQVATDSHVAVSEWGTSGQVVDTNLQQGHLLDFKNATSLLAKIITR